jgi:hypothetical protein
MHRKQHRMCSKGRKRLMESCRLFYAFFYAFKEGYPPPPRRGVRGGVPLVGRGRASTASCPAGRGEGHGASMRVAQQGGAGPEGRGSARPSPRLSNGRGSRTRAACSVHGKARGMAHRGGGHGKAGDAARVPSARVAARDSPPPGQGPPGKATGRARPRGNALPSCAPQSAAPAPARPRPSQAGPRRCAP